MMFKAYRFLLQPTPSQAASLNEWIGTASFVWNIALEQRRLWLKRGRFINFSEQCKQLTEAKADKTDFLNNLPAQALQQTLMDLDRACRKHNVWRVHFKKRSHARSMGLRLPDGKNIVVKKLNKRHDMVKLPKLGWVKFTACRRFTGVIKSATVVREHGRYFISVLVNTGIEAVTLHQCPDSIVGIDRGVKIPIATSDQELWVKRNFTQKELDRHKLLQRKLCRQKKWSKNYYKTLRRMNVIKRREVHRRESFLNKCANTLTKKYETVCLEKLQTSNMTKSAKGTVEAPGKNVKQKSGLNRSILAMGWFMLQTKLEQKSLETGSKIVYVDPKYTSQTCSVCGFKDSGNRESQAVFLCLNCGHTMNADVNAALNIRNRGQEALVVV